MAEFNTGIATQSVPLNQAVALYTAIRCPKGYVYHEDGTGIVILRGIVPNPNSCFARYKITFNGNVALPESGTPGPIAVSLSVNGESRPASIAIVTPTAAEAFFNVTSTATVDVPRGCCFSLAVRHVPASTDPTVTPAPVIEIANGNLDIQRTA